MSGEVGLQPLVDVLVPTVGRTTELAVTLSGLAAQADPRFAVIVSDQSETGAVGAAPVVAAMIRALEDRHRPVDVLPHLPRRGMAEQRAFLLARATAPYVLFLDDDVWLEPGTLRMMVDALERLGCGFVGAAPQGLSYLHDRRPHEHGTFEPWDGAVAPEVVRPGTAAFDRWPLHNAANLTHLAPHLPAGAEWAAYRIAWVGACVLYRRDALLDCGGFDFWRDLPPEHAGEDVAAQWRVMEHYGGAGLLPSGAVHLESPTTVTDRRVQAADVVFAGEPAR
jgi:GT2 family glycosyltransferase